MVGGILAFCEIERFHLTVLGLGSPLLAGTRCDSPPTLKAPWPSSAVMLLHGLGCVGWEAKKARSCLGPLQRFFYKKDDVSNAQHPSGMGEGAGLQGDPGVSFSFEMNCAHLGGCAHPPPQIYRLEWTGSMSPRKSLLRACLLWDVGRWGTNEGKAPDPVPPSFPGELYPQLSNLKGPGRQRRAWDRHAAPPDGVPAVTAPLATSNYIAAGKNEVMVSASDFLHN